MARCIHLFSGAINDGRLYVFEFETDIRRIVNLKQQCIIDLECEIFGLLFCEKNDCLLIATNNGLMGWNNSQRYCAFVYYVKGTLRQQILQ